MAAARSIAKEQFAKNQKELAELCKRRFFFRPASDIYGGTSGFFSYGPPGCAVKNNLIQQWRMHFVIEENLLEVEDTCIMPHNVLKASGHVDRFNDFMVKDVTDESKFIRADKLLEDVMEARIKEETSEAKKSEFQKIFNMAGSYSLEEIGEVLKKYQVKSPEGNDLTDPYEFNLMFPTPIGPGGYLQGYLRPETAQGIFLNYKYCIEQNGNRLPFGVAQIGKSFRNEIAPRGGLTRQREFTQAEIEFFVNPNAKNHPKFAAIANQELTLFPSKQQLAAQEPIKMTVGQAVKNGIINNETLGYYIYRTFKFLLSVGIHEQYLRFRQHLPTEMAHYASDCWDAEIFSSFGWLESVGIADRACFDLNAHAEAAKVDLKYKETLDKPIEREILAITKKSGIEIMKAFAKAGRGVKEWLEARPQEELEKLQADLAKGNVDVEVDGQTHTLTPQITIFEKKKEKISVRSFYPGVIEPSFGIDRIFTSIMEHNYYARPKDANDDEKQTRGVLAYPANIAPYKCTILPLDQRIVKDPKGLQLMQQLRRDLAEFGLSTIVDDSGATIGKRYARNDELGSPFAVTFDFDTLKDETVTMRERDSMEQIRLPVSEAAELIRTFCAGLVDWSSTSKKYSK